MARQTRKLTQGAHRVGGDGRAAPADPSAPHTPHTPVMLAEVLATLAPVSGELIIDGTFGAGGYTSAILDASRCRVIAFDRDITAIRAADPLVARYAGRLTPVNATFGFMETIARRLANSDPSTKTEGPFVDGIVLDIGVSSMQLDQPARGFSFQADGPLDMRMSPPVDPRDGTPVATVPSAAEFLGAAEADEIADVLYQYGEEKRSRAIARAIVDRRAQSPLATTKDLADLVARVLGRRHDDGRHPATRTFQALRIHVNDELGELARGLASAERLLKPGGRLVVVTFHSLEDRVVKRFLSEAAGRQAAVSRHMPTAAAPPPPSFRLLNLKPLLPGVDEIAGNPRARSAKLRAAVRTEAPALRRDFASLGLPRLATSADI